MQLTDGIVFDNVNGEFPTENKNIYFVESCSFHFRNKDGPCGYTHFIKTFIPICRFCFCKTLSMYGVHLCHTMLKGVQLYNIIMVRNRN